MMLGDIRVKDGKDTIIMIDAPYEGYFTKEGNYKVDVCFIDTETKNKGYVMVLLLDQESGNLYKGNLRIKSAKDVDEMVPLEKMLRLAIAEELDNSTNLYGVEMDVVEGLSCQVTVRQHGNYHNITGVFSMDEELAPFVPRQLNNGQRLRHLFDFDIDK